MSEPLYDEQCEMLAAYFLDAEGLNSPLLVVDLANRIQTAVDDYFAELNSDADNDV